MVSAVIFDCFGVIIYDALQELVANSELAPAQKKSIDELIVSANRGIIDSSKAHSKIAQLLDTTNAQYEQKIKDGEVKNIELLDFILSLKPRFKIGMLSNVGSLDSLNRRFNARELEKYFDAVVASGSVGFAKPEARAYEIAAQRLNVRLDQCVMIDDIRDYCDGAISVGMQAILYKSNDQVIRELAVKGII